MQLTIGRIRVDTVSDGTARLDGGAMFGVVPKTLWSRVFTPDEKNRITLAMGAILIRTRDDIVLVDTGIGQRWSPKEVKIYDIRRDPTLNDSLAAVGVRPEDVTKVINTHLHFDHCGGNTIDVDGRTVPAFPNARYFVQKGEYEWAVKPTLRDRASYLAPNFIPLHEAGRLTLLDGNAEVAAGVRVHRLPGHTPNLQGVFVEDAGETLCFPSDLIPTARHLPLAWGMGYDLEPLVAMRNKVDLLEEAARGGWICVFQHDPDTPVGRVRIEDGKPVFVPLPADSR